MATTPGTWVIKYTDFPQVSQLGHLTGTYDSSKFETGFLPPEVVDEIINLNQLRAPVTWFIRRVKKRGVSNYKFEWWDADVVAYAAAVDSNGLADQGTTGNSTTVGVASGHGARFRVGDIVLVVETGEKWRVTAVSGDTLTITRDFTGTFSGSAPAVSASAELMIIANFVEEGSSPPSSVFSVRRHFENITGIIRRSKKLTGTVMALRTYAGSELARAERELLEEFTGDIERAILYSEKTETTLNGEPYRMPDGILKQLGWDENAGTASKCAVLDLSGGFSLSNFISFNKEVFFYDGGEPKLLVASPELIAFLIENFNTNVTGVTQFRDFGADQFKMNLRSIDLGFGPLVLVPHYLLKTKSKLKGIVLPLKRIEYVYLEGNGVSRDMYRNIQPVKNENGEDATRIDYICECSVMVRVPESFGIVKGNAGYAV